MDGLVFYAKARAFKAKATSSRLRPRSRNLALRPRINIPAVHKYCQSTEAKIQI